MAPNPDQLHDPDEDDAIPSRLRADLNALHPRPVVPPGIDEAVWNAARAYLVRQRRVRLWARWGGAAAAVAAVLVIGFRVSSPPGGPGSRAAPAVALRVGPAAGDVDGNGVVDVLDAFTVARGVKAGRTQPAWDVTRDGVVDGLDVDRIATSAVAVKGGPQ